MLHKLSKTVSRKNRELCEEDITTAEIQKDISIFKTTNLLEMIVLRGNSTKFFWIYS